MLHDAVSIVSAGGLAPTVNTIKHHAAFLFANYAHSNFVNIRNVDEGFVFGHCILTTQNEISSYFVIDN